MKWQKIYTTTSTILGEKHVKGRWSEDEIEQLVHNCNRYQDEFGDSVLNSVYGKNGKEKWILLGQGINRPVHSLRTKVRSLFGVRLVARKGFHTKNHDRNRRYSPAEDRQIVRGLQKVRAIGAMGSFPEIKINWKAISAKVKARTATSCQQRWTKYLATHEDFTHRPHRFSRADVRVMFKLVRDDILANQIQNDWEIPWIDVLSRTGIPLLPHEIKMKFRGLMNRNFKRSSRLTFIQKVNLLRRVSSIKRVSDQVTHWNDWILVTG